jgi:hypothetical protein
MFVCDSLFQLFLFSQAHRITSRQWFYFSTGRMEKSKRIGQIKGQIARDRRQMS